MIDNGKRTYSVSPRGKKFVTVARVDGLWVCEWVSKNRRLADWKGRQFVAKRREPRRVVWVYHRAERFLALAV